MVWCMNFYSRASNTNTSFIPWLSRIVPSFKCNGNRPHTNPSHIAIGLVYTPSPLQLPQLIAITELCCLYSHGCRQQKSLTSTILLNLINKSDVQLVLGWKEGWMFQYSLTIVMNKVCLLTGFWLNCYISIHSHDLHCYKIERIKKDVKSAFAHEGETLHNECWHQVQLKISSVNRPTWK